VNTVANNGLLFPWEAPRPRKLAILGFLVVSAAGHALCFYLFQIVYPPIVALLPPPARVSLISPHSEEGGTLLRWIEAEDPALASTTQRPADAKAFALPKLSHLPSYSVIRPALKPLPPSSPDLRAPSLQLPRPVQIPRAKASPPVNAAPTAIMFSDELQALGAVAKPQMKLTALTREPPQTATLRVGVTSDGHIRYCFLQSSSGDTALDQQVRHYLTLCRFAGIPFTGSAEKNRLHWGRAIIEWGNDIATPSPASDNLP
jgi:hypothetical protein